MSTKPVIWITGASSGIGEATAYRFAQDQASLILTATRAERLVEVQQ
ncbi:MAG TPA: SDR family NAD(P)-dependent oxidoreductase, partial [Proteiniphilum sp.]|nr:SDR family NAD(P)-dependent oxidoreductase [Proteiniphilum sp.]